MPPLQLCDDMQTMMEQGFCFPPCRQALQCTLKDAQFIKLALRLSNDADEQNKASTTCVTVSWETRHFTQAGLGACMASNKAPRELPESACDSSIRAAHLHQLSKVPSTFASLQMAMRKLQPQARTQHVIIRVKKSKTLAGPVPF